MARKPHPPAAIRRVIVGTAADGSVQVTEDMAHAFQDVFVAWGAAAPPRLPTDGSPERAADPGSWSPVAGGTKVLLFTVPPQSAAAPPLGDVPDWGVLEADGFHATDTVDSIIVISGDVGVELAGGVEVLLKSGDVLIQNGAMHAWRNHGDGWPLVAAFVVGAERAEPAG
jgi:hypothetical protein